MLRELYTHDFDVYRKKTPVHTFLFQGNDVIYPSFIDHSIIFRSVFVTVQFFQTFRNFKIEQI